MEISLKKMQSKNKKKYTWRNDRNILRIQWHARSELVIRHLPPPLFFPFFSFCFSVVSLLWSISTFATVQQHPKRREAGIGIKSEKWETRTKKVFPVLLFLLLSYSTSPSPSHLLVGVHSGARCTTHSPTKRWIGWPSKERYPNTT